jgi:hypothetical protein
MFPLTRAQMQIIVGCLTSVLLLMLLAACNIPGLSATQPTIPTAKISVVEQVRQLVKKVPGIYGTITDVTYTDYAKEAAVIFTLPSDLKLDNQITRTMIETNCFAVQHALWTNAIPLEQVTIVVRGSLINQPGHTSVGYLWTAILHKKTARLFKWNTLSFTSAWNDYDEQWLIANLRTT